MSRCVGARGSVIALGIALLAGALSPQTAAAPAPTPTKPGGLAPQAKAAAAGDGVHIVKSTTGLSCTGYDSQTVPPPTIRVLVHGNPDKVVTVRFQDYLDNVLPNEWIASWDTAAIKAGAIAVKSYAWYWVNHYGGYYQTPNDCFDVTDDTNFQVYKPNSTNPRTSDAVLATRNIAAQQHGQVPQTSYRASLSTNPSGPEPCGAGANGTTMSQYGSQACGEAGDSFAQILQVYYSNKLQLVPVTGQLGAWLAPADLAMSGATTPTLFGPRGAWSVRGVTGGSYQFGWTGDIPAITDGGDGWARIGVFRPSNGNWYLQDLFFGDSTTIHWGYQGDVPVTSHYNGLSEPTLLAVFRPANGNWYIYGQPSFHYGANGDIPVPGHYAAAAASDYTDAAAVFRPANGNWYVRGVGSVHWGAPHDTPVPADYNGDGETDLAVYRPSTHTFYVRESTDLTHDVHTVKLTWGTTGDIPVTGDFNGDGRADLAVYRPATHTWWVSGQPPITFGFDAGSPVETAPYSG